MGETINLVNNFKVEKVIFNWGPYNDLEKELIKVLEKKNIKYYSCIKDLNTDVYGNENDNSNVIYFNYNNYKFLFMEDERIEKEKDILEKYNLKKINQDKTIGIIISKKENKYSHKIKCEHFWLIHHNI